MIRDYGSAVEADLAFQGIDLRDVFRPGSGMTLRRLAVLVRGIGPDSNLGARLRADAEKALKPTAEQIRDRAEHYRRRAEEAAS